MPHSLDANAFAWLEGSRAFSVAFGTLLAAACLSVAVPTLWWCLPETRTWVFSKRADPRQVLQLFFGIFGMAMACTNALCRYIPHRPLGLVHPVFFFTTVALVVVLGPFVIATASHRERPAMPGALLAASLTVLVASPLAAVVNAFCF